MTVVELGKVANVSWGDTSVTKSSYIDSGYKAYSATGQDGFLPDYDFEQPGIVLSAIGARCGKCFKANGRWKAIKNTITITASEDMGLDIDYLYYITNNESFWPKRGVAQPFIGLGDARKVKINLPSLPEQKRIAAILDAADALRTKRRESIEQLDKLLQSTFLAMFGDPVTNSKEWDTKSLIELCDPDRGISYGVVQRGDHDPHGIPLIRIRDILTGEIDISQLIRCNIKVVSKYKRTNLLGGELVISIRGTVGRVALVPPTLKGGNITREIALIPLLPEVNSDFTLELLKTDSVFNRLAEDVKGVAQRGVNLRDLRELRVIQPPESLQNEFAKIVTGTRQLRALLQSHLTELNSLFASLQSRAFRGEL